MKFGGLDHPWSIFIWAALRRFVGADPKQQFGKLVAKVYFLHNACAEETGIHRKQRERFAIGYDGPWCRTELRKRFLTEGRVSNSERSHGTTHPLAGIR